MNPNFIQGRLQLRPENLQWDLPFVKALVTTVTEPQLKKQLYNEHVQFYSAEFTATPEQWREIEPELKKMGIEVNLYEMPHLYYQVQAQQERDLARTREKSKLRLISVAGFLIGAAACLSLFAFQNLTVFIGLGLLGLIVWTIGSVALDFHKEKTDEAAVIREKLGRR